MAAIVSEGFSFMEDIKTQKSVLFNWNEDWGIKGAAPLPLAWQGGLALCQRLASLTLQGYL